MTATDEILITVLAHSDALLLPIRKWVKHASANRAAGLAMLRTHGVPHRVGGDDASRKSGERQLAEIATQGLLTVRRHGRARYPYCQLTPHAESLARAMCNLPDLAAGLEVLRAVAERTKRDATTLDELWCDEVALNGGKGWGFDETPEDRRGLSRIELRALPALSRGWLAAHSTVQGHVRYRVTSLGWSQLDRPADLATATAPPEQLPGAAALYRAEQDAKFRELEVSEPATPGDIGTLPLPVAHVGIPIPAAA